MGCSRIVAKQGAECTRALRPEERLSRHLLPTLRLSYTARSIIAIRSVTPRAGMRSSSAADTGGQVALIVAVAVVDGVASRQPRFDQYPGGISRLYPSIQTAFGALSRRFVRQRGPTVAGVLVLVGVLFGALGVVTAQDRAVILHTNDFHGKVHPRGEVGGIRGLDQMVRAVRTEVGADRVLLLDAGDWFQGTPEGNVPKGKMIVDLFSAMKVDAAAVGNHDLDFGEDNLKELITRAKFPVVSSNLVDEAGETRSYVKPYVMLEAGGIRFGVVGLLTPDTKNIVPRSVAANLSFAALADSVRKWIPRMRAEGAECIVVLSHSGVDAEKKLASEVDGIDLVVGGHSHTLLDVPWVAENGTVVVQAGSYGAHLGRMEVTRREGGGFQITGRPHPVRMSTTGSPEIEAVFEEYASRVAGPVIDKVIGESPATLAKPKRKLPFPHSSALGNWLCKTLLDATGKSIAIHNKGGVRADIPVGGVTRRVLFEVSPFGNRVAVCRFKGETLAAIIDRGFAESNRRLEMVGIDVQWSLIDGRPQVDTIFVNGSELDPDAVYEVATNSYLAEGGDNWDEFPQEGEPQVLDTPLYEASVTFLQKPEGVAALSESDHDAYSQVGTMSQRFTALFGLFTLLGLCFLFSRDRSKISLRVVVWGLALQALFAFLVLETGVGQWFFVEVKSIFVAIMDYAKAGNEMVFGPLADEAALTSAFGRGFVFFTQILGTIVLVSALTAVLYHIGVLQLVVYVMARVMQWTMKTSGAESLAAAANVFVGQTEAPLIVRPYLLGMTSSEIMSMMTGGMATVAGGVLAAYAGFGIDAGHLLAASVMSAPAALVVAKVLIPETEKSQTGAHVPYEVKRTDVNLIDALCRGAGEGFKLALNVMAMLLALVAVVALLNGMIDWGYQLSRSGWVEIFGDVPKWLPDAMSLQWILGKLFQPFAWLLGVPWSEADKVGSLLGTRMILNEFLAYLDLSAIRETISPRSVTLATYALCGFANFSSIAIQIGGISGLEGGLRTKLAKLGFIAMIGGTIATMMTAAIVGVFV